VLGSLKGQVRTGQQVQSRVGIWATTIGASSVL